MGILGPGYPGWPQVGLGGTLNQRERFQNRQVWIGPLFCYHSATGTAESIPIHHDDGSPGSSFFP
jgi:hypothetical protein